MADEPKTPLQLRAEKYAAMVQNRPGGWREETSPDGRITMYVSPQGERLSKSEFAEQYPQGTGSPDYMGSKMVDDIASGRLLPSFQHYDPNVRSGVVLIPGSTKYDMKSRFDRRGSMRPLDTERTRGGLDILRPSKMFHDVDRNVDFYRDLLAKAEASGDAAKIAAQRDQLEGILEMRAREYARYKKMETPGERPLMGTSAREDELLELAKQRAAPIPFPDRKGK